MTAVRTFYGCPFDAEFDVSTAKLELLLDLFTKGQLAQPEKTFREAGNSYAILMRSVSTLELATLCLDFMSQTVTVAVTSAKRPEPPAADLNAPLTERERVVASHLARTHGITQAQSEIHARRLAALEAGVAAKPREDPAQKASDAFNDQYALDHVVKLASTLGVPFNLSVGETGDQKPAGEKTPTTK